MIQRIQTLYLLLAAVMLVGALFFPWGTFFAADGTAYSFEAFSVKQSVGAEMASIQFWALGIVLIIAAVVVLVNIFCFKKRMLQVRLCVFNAIVLIGYFIVFVVFLFITKSQLDASFRLNFGTALPLVALIFNHLAFNAILKDENKVRAYQRIRK